jgi:hypothetical protein
MRTFLSWSVMLVAATPSLACDFYRSNSIEEVMELMDDLKDRASVPLNSAKSYRTTVEGLDVPGMLQVQEGRSCAARSKGGVYLVEAAALPPGLDQGTVIFNGGVAAYSGGDHEVAILGTGAITDVEIRSGQLVWKALGALSDDNGDDLFEWCYSYALVFWKQGSAELRATVPAANGPRIFGSFPVLNSAGPDPTPVHSIAGFLNAPDPTFGGPRALLPRGVATWYTANDYNVLQAGFDLGTPSPSGDTISWTSRTLLADGDQRPHHGVELVEVMNGASVNMWQPPVVSRLRGGQWVPEKTGFRLRAEDDEGIGCVDDPQTAIVNTYQVEVPFPYAVPMLTGWQLNSGCSDSQVRQIGAFINGWSFTPYPNANGGTLKYRVVGSLDDGSGRLNDMQHRVTILGLHRVGRLDSRTNGGVPPVLAPM